MSRRIAWVMGSIVLGASASAGPPPPAPAPPGTQALQQVRAEAVRLAAATWEKVEAATGAAAAVARPSAKTVWVTAVNVPGQSNSAEAGFKLQALTSGAAMRDVTARVVFDVQAVSGVAIWKLEVFEGHLTTGARAMGRVAAAGTHVEAETTALTLESGKRYEVRATVLVWPSGAANAGAYAVARITGLEWRL